MVTWLPIGSPLHRAVQDHHWTDDSVMMWDLTKQLRDLNATLANIFSEEGTAPVKPEYLPLPDAIREVAEATHLDDAQLEELEEVHQNMQAIWGPTT